MVLCLRYRAVHIAAALFDPFVAPPGQFAIFNSWLGEKSLFTLDAGHFDYPERVPQENALRIELLTFFNNLEKVSNATRISSMV